LTQSALLNRRDSTHIAERERERESSKEERVTYCRV